MAYRRSIYADNFPWNLNSKALPVSDAFNHVKERLARVICLTISPEVSEAEQCTEAETFIKVLKQL